MGRHKKTLKEKLAMKPTPRDIIFINEYLKHGKKQQAAREAYSATVKESALSQTANNKLKQKHIQLAIQEAMQEANIDPAWIIAQRQSLIKKGMQLLEEGDTKVMASDIHQNLKDLEKLMNMYGDNSSGNNTTTGGLHQHIHLHDKPRDEILKEREKLQKFFTDIES